MLALRFRRGYIETSSVSSASSGSKNENRFIFIATWIHEDQKKTQACMTSTFSVKADGNRRVSGTPNIYINIEYIGEKKIFKGHSN